MQKDIFARFILQETAERLAYAAQAAGFPYPITVTRRTSLREAPHYRVNCAGRCLTERQVDELEGKA